MPTTATRCMFCGYLTILIIRSVPILPDPIIAAFALPMLTHSSNETGDAMPDTLQFHAKDIAFHRRRQRNQAARENHIASVEGDTIRSEGIRQPGNRHRRRSLNGGAITLRKRRAVLRDCHMQPR